MRQETDERRHPITTEINKLANIRWTCTGSDIVEPAAAHTLLASVYEVSPSWRCLYPPPTADHLPSDTYPLHQLSSWLQPPAAVAHLHASPDLQLLLSCLIQTCNKCVQYQNFNYQHNHINMLTHTRTACHRLCTHNFQHLCHISNSCWRNMQLFTRLLIGELNK